MGPDAWRTCSHVGLARCPFMGEKQLFLTRSTRLSPAHVLHVGSARLLDAEHVSRDTCSAWDLRALAQARIFQNSIQNLPARAARKNFVKICLARSLPFKICLPRSLPGSI